MIEQIGKLMPIVLYTINVCAAIVFISGTYEAIKTNYSADKAVFCAILSVFLIFGCVMGAISIAFGPVTMVIN